MTCDAHQAGRHRSTDIVAEFHLLGELDFEDGLALQRRLVYEASQAATRRLTVLMCEHAGLITVGRNGSRRDIRRSGEQLARAGLELRWVSRGGGAVPHAEGQLAVYAVVHLPALAWSVGSYVGRLHAGVRAALEALNIRTQARPGSFGVWGRSGLLAAAGVAVRHETTCHGMFLNVHPAMAPFGFVDTFAAGAAAGEKTTMSSLVAESRRSVRMSGVRSSLVEQLVEAFDCTRYHIHSGHPWLRTRDGSHV